MTLPNHEKILANIVVLSATDATILLSGDEIGSILRDADVQAMGQPAQQMQLTSLREQVRVILLGGQFIFEDRSADLPPRARLPEIVDQFVRLFASKGVSQFRAYGFNFDVAFDAPGSSLAAQLVMERFLKPDEFSRRASITLKGAGLRLYFSCGEANCDLRIEPRENKLDAPMSFSHINYHYDLAGVQFPAQDLLKSDFLGKWTVFTDTLSRLLIDG